MTFQLSVCCSKRDAHHIEFDVKITPGLPKRVYLLNGDPGNPDEGVEIEVQSVQLCFGSRRRVLDLDKFFDKRPDVWSQVQFCAEELAALEKLHGRPEE